MRAVPVLNVMPTVKDCNNGFRAASSFGQHMYPSSGIDWSGQITTVAPAGSEEIFKIGNFDLPREGRDVHYAHCPPQNQPASHVPTNRHPDSTPDYSSFGQPGLRLLSVLLVIVDRAGTSPRATHGESPHPMRRKPNLRRHPRMLEPIGRSAGASRVSRQHLRGHPSGAPCCR